MKKTLIALSLVLSFGLVAPAILPNNSQVAYADAKTQIQSGLKAAGGDTKDTSGTLITKVINVMLFIIGVLSVIMIVYGGILYVISAGDSGRVSKAKNTIMYAIVGLVVALLAYAIVNFVITRF
jgi:hypothetical protein